MVKEMRRNLRGRVVLVTGASRGIGRRTAERLAKLGARLALTARSAEDLAKVVGECRARRRGRGVPRRPDAARRSRTDRCRRPWSGSARSMCW